MMIMMMMCLDVTDTDGDWMWPRRHRPHLRLRRQQRSTETRPVHYWDARSGRRVHWPRRRQRPYQHPRSPRTDSRHIPSQNSLPASMIFTSCILPLRCPLLTEVFCIGVYFCKLLPHRSLPFLYSLPFLSSPPFPPFLYTHPLTRPTLGDLWGSAYKLPQRVRAEPGRQPTFGAFGAEKMLLLLIKAV